MARLSVREYEHIALVASGTVMVGQEPAIATQTLTIVGSSIQSAAFNERTHFVRVHCDVLCSLDFRTNPVAAPGTCDLAAGQTEYFGVAGGQKLAVIST